MPNSIRPSRPHPSPHESMRPASCPLRAPPPPGHLVRLWMWPAQHVRSDHVWTPAHARKLMPWRVGGEGCQT